MSKQSYGWLFDGHAAGHYDLPADLLQAHAALLTLNAHTIPEAPARPTDPAADMLDAAYAGKPLPTRFDFEDAGREQRATQLAFEALAQAKAEQRSIVHSMVSEQAERIITDYLQPAYATVITAAARAASLLDGADISAHGMARADAKTRKALTDVTVLVDRYTTLRGAWSRLFELRPVQYSQYLRAFGETRSPLTYWPEIASTQALPQGMDAPWPTSDNMSRLLWMATHPDVEPWCPTPDEYDQRVAEVFADRIEGLARGRAGKASLPR